MDAIATRVHHDIVRARRFPHASLDDADPGASEAIVAAADAALLAAREASPATLRFSEDAFGELCEQAASDVDLQRLLGALAMGATSKDDVMFVTGMSDPEYRATRGRLDRLVERSPREVRPKPRKNKARSTKAPREPASSDLTSEPCHAATPERLPDRAREAGAMTGIPTTHRGPATSDTAHPAARL